MLTRQAGLVPATSSGAGTRMSTIDVGVSETDFGRTPARRRRSFPIARVYTVSVILSLLACVPVEDVRERDEARYLRILQDSQTSGEELIRDCQRIGESVLRGDCSLAIALRWASSGDAMAWCALIEPGFWRDECLFDAAESAAIRRNFDLAQQLCDQAGTFQTQCNFHTFQIVADAEAGIPGDLNAAEQHYAELLETWHIQGAPAARERMWIDWFTSVFVAKGMSDEGGCLTISAEHRSACESGLKKARAILKRAR